MGLSTVLVVQVDKYQVGFSLIHIHLLGPGRNMVLNTVLVVQVDKRTSREAHSLTPGVCRRNPRSRSQREQDSRCMEICGNIDCNCKIISHCECEHKSCL